jgi:aspartate aminotransferase
MQHIGPLGAFFRRSRWAERVGSPDIADFVVGNPHEMPLAGITTALQTWATPRNKDWFGYKFSEPEAQTVVAQSLRERVGIEFEPGDICLTNGAFAALAATLRAVADAGDDVIYISPPWFFYQAMIRGLGATPVAVQVMPDTFDLDVDAIASAITRRTRAIIVNSPHNPTGRIYPPEALERLGAALRAASQRHGRTIYLLSDEAYSRIVFDGAEFSSPVAHYDAAFLIYTYGKTLLTPGQRVGYVAIPPSMPNRDEVRSAVFIAQMVTGYLFPNALLQHAIGDLEQLSIDIDHLQAKRDRLVTELREMGYHVNAPEGTFYLLPRAPIANDMVFVELLAERDVFVLPGSLVELPGHFRISLTANDEMIERALPVFEWAMTEASTRAAATADG